MSSCFNILMCFSLSLFILSSMLLCFSICNIHIYFWDVFSCWAFLSSYHLFTFFNIDGRRHFHLRIGWTVWLKSWIRPTVASNRLISSVCLQRSQTDKLSKGWLSWNQLDIWGIVVQIVSLMPLLTAVRLLDELIAFFAPSVKSHS